MPVAPVVFVHGAGATGAEAWPHQAQAREDGWFFMSRADAGDNADLDADRVVARLRDTGGGHVVAHSYGANAALLAAQREPSVVWSLALLEPACFDLSRGRPAVEEHISAMTPVFDVADDASVSARDFSRRFSAGMGFEPLDVPDAELDARVSRLRSLLPPWGLGLTRGAVGVRTLVVTGGVRPLYEETAMSLVDAGARHLVLEGAGHRIQDDRRTTQVLRAHWG